jgi:hypothetical protein
VNLHFITTDMARWGAGQERPLTAAQLDETIWSLKVAVDAAVEQSPPKISAIRVVATNNMWIDMTDGASFGPFALPVANLVGRGEWAPGVGYNQNDLFSRGAKAYVVLHPHTSDATFSEGKTDGSGNIVYSKILEIQDSIPAGGDQGMVLVKKSSTDRDTVWAFQIGLMTPGGVAGQIPVKQSAAYADIQWSSAVELPAYGQVDVEGDITIDFANGECQRLSMTDTVSSVTFANFGKAGRASKLVLEIWNTGNFLWHWPADIYWQGSSAPVVTGGFGKKDVYVLMTMDGGETIYGNSVGQDYGKVAP